MESMRHLDIAASLFGDYEKRSRAAGVGDDLRRAAFALQGALGATRERIHDWGADDADR